MKTQSNPETLKFIIIRAEEFNHNNERRIKLIFNCDVKTTRTIKKLKGSI